MNKKKKKLFITFSKKKIKIQVGYMGSKNQKVHIER